ncbi:hypothetical protein KCU93_g1, partial [Aureobasidium melanogenum]
MLPLHHITLAYCQYMYFTIWYCLAIITNMQLFNESFSRHFIVQPLFAAIYKNAGIDMKQTPRLVSREQFLSLRSYIVDDFQLLMKRGQGDILCNLIRYR